MKAKHILPNTDFPALPQLPPWARLGGGEPSEDAAFMSGAALATLHLLLGREDAPHALLRARMALRAAEANVGFSGRFERASDLRDAVHLLRAGEDAGPAGALYQAWDKAAARPLSVSALHRALPDLTPEQITLWLDGGEGAPVARSAAVLETVLDAFPHNEEIALILADAVLALAMGWEQLMPLLAYGLTRRDLAKTGEPLRQACHQALAASAGQVVQTGCDLTRRAARLKAVAPKLRAKGAGQAVALFLRRDALAPSLALTGLMSDRAARRLCDRLVTLGAIRELTGRESFRLYGV